MFNAETLRLGKERSAIRELYEYALKRGREIGAENVFDFSLGGPSSPAPDCVEESIRKLLDEMPSEKLHAYTSAPGLMETREAVASSLRSTYGADISADRVYMTCGASASLTAVFHALCEKGDEIAVITPYFPEYRVFIEGAGGKVAEVMTDSRFHLDFDALEKAIGKRTKAVLLNTPNNPTGAVCTEEEIKTLARLLEKKSAEQGRPVYLVSDEPYRELAYGASVLFPANYYKNTIVCYSYSKSLTLAGERIGYVAVNNQAEQGEDLFAAVCGAGRLLGFVCAPVLFQRVMIPCAGAVSDKEVYRANRDLLTTSLADMGYAFAEPDGAFYLFMKSPEPDAKAFAERAKKHELLLVPSDSFGVTGYVRISYCVPTERIQRALPAFEALAREYHLK